MITIEFEKQMRIDIDQIPVSVNAIYKRAKMRSGKPGMYMTQKAKQFKEELAWSAKMASKKYNWKFFKENRFFYVDLYFTFKSKKRFVDPNNTHKVTLDALEGILFENDKWALTRDMDAKFGDKEHLTIVLRIPKIKEEK